MTMINFRSKPVCVCCQILYMYISLFFTRMSRNPYPCSTMSVCLKKPKGLTFPKKKMTVLFSKLFKYALHITTQNNYEL